MKKLFFLSGLLTFALLACNKEEANLPAVNDGEIVFTAQGDGIEASVHTRATTEVKSLSSFNVLCVTGTAGSSESSVFNVSFTGPTNYTGGKYWPSTNPSYKFYASNASMTSAAGGPTISASNGTDIVCATCLSPTYNESNALTFEHIFARVGSCNISAPTDGCSVSNLTVKITPKTSGTYSLYTGKGKTDGTGWSSTSNGSVVTLASSTGSTTDNQLYLVPGSYTLDIAYTLTQGDFTKSYTKHSTVSLVGGKVNNLTATLPGAGSDLSPITFTVTVNPWGSNAITMNITD